LPPLKANLAPTNPFSSKRQRVALSLHISVAETHRPERCLFSDRSPLRSGRTELAPYASSLVVSDIAEAELVGGSGRPGPWPQPTVKLVGGAATAQTQGYVRHDESQIDAGCAW
jgi:hypothetical protein